VGKSAKKKRQETIVSAKTRVSKIFLRFSDSYLAEPRPLLAEQGCLCDTSRVHAGKDDSSVLVVSVVELRNSHHVANLKKAQVGVFS
jgi:hypothetical protein